MCNCGKMIELISRRLDEQLTQEEEACLARHLAECPACAALARDLSKFHQILEDWAPPMPDGFVQDVMARIEADRTQPYRGKARSWKIWGVWGGLAAAMVLVVLGVSQLQPLRYLSGAGGSTKAELPASAPEAQMESAQPSVQGYDMAPPTMKTDMAERQTEDGGKPQPVPQPSREPDHILMATQNGEGKSAASPADWQKAALLVLEEALEGTVVKETQPDYLTAVDASGMDYTLRPESGWGEDGVYRFVLAASDGTVSYWTADVQTGAVKATEP